MPTPLPTESGALLSRVRELIAEKILTVPGAGHAYPQHMYVENETDYVEKFMVEEQGLKVVRNWRVSFAGFDETAAANKSKVGLRFKIELAYGFVPQYEDGSTSETGFSELVMRVREAFKDDRTFGYTTDELWHYFLQMPTDATMEKPDGYVCHMARLSLRVEIRR